MAGHLEILSFLAVQMCSKVRKTFGAVSPNSVCMLIPCGFVKEDSDSVEQGLDLSSHISTEPSLTPVLLFHRQICC